MTKRWLVFLLILLIPLIVLAQQFTGKCVAVTDGDTIGILRDGKEVKVRLDGIDCPEMGQDFGSKAKKFTSNLVFDEEVIIDQKDTDKYGRIVARVIVDGKDVSLELVKAGLAWFYREYSHDTVLSSAEKIAKEDEEGLWALSSPVAPWDYRHGTASSQTPSKSVQQAPKESPDTQKEITVYITRTGAKYHRAGCTYLRKSMIPSSKTDAISRGYTPCSRCSP
jgi:micrococcal nuclease